MNIPIYDILFFFILINHHLVLREISFSILYPFKIEINNLLFYFIAINKPIFYNLKEKNYIIYNLFDRYHIIYNKINLIVYFISSFSFFVVIDLKTYNIINYNYTYIYVLMFQNLIYFFFLFKRYFI